MKSQTIYTKLLFIVIGLGILSLLIDRVPDLEELERNREFVSLYEGTTNANLVNLQNCHRLKVLKISNSEIDDDGLPHLQQVPTLKELYIEGCDNITDIGIESLGILTSLEIIKIHGCPNVTEEAIKELQIKLPNCKITKY